MIGLLCGLKAAENGVDPRLLEVAPVEVHGLALHFEYFEGLSKNCLTQRGAIS